MNIIIKFSVLQTWLCIATSIALMGPILNWFHRSTPYYDYFNTRTKGGLQTVGNCIWYMYGALLQQGKRRGVRSLNEGRFCPINMSAVIKLFQ